MNTYTCNDFTGHYPVGVAAVILAPDRKQALAKLNATLKEAGLPGDALLRDILPLEAGDMSPVCRILNDGNY